MTTRGDLLALVDSAPRDLRTLQGAVTTWTHRDLAAEARAWATEQAGDDHDRFGAVAPLQRDPWSDPDEVDELADAGDVGDDEVPPAARAHPGRGTGAPGEPEAAGAYDADAASLHIPRWPPPRPGDADAGPEVLLSWYVAVALPDRWRVVGRGQIAVSDGHRSWAGTSTLVTERDSARAAIHDAGVIGACLYPGACSAGSSWPTPSPPRSRAARAGSSTRCRGPSPPRPLAGRQRRAPRPCAFRATWWASSTGSGSTPPPASCCATRASSTASVCSTTRLTDLVVDAELPDDEFRPPPGAVVRARHELLRDHLAEMGVDPDSVDLDDPAQVRAALRGAG